MPKEKTMRRHMSVFDRCFRAADRWVKPWVCANPKVKETAHIAYRCGWYAGYNRAMRDAKKRATDY